MSTRQFSKHTVSTTQPMGGQAGDEWFHPVTNQLFKLLAINGSTLSWREIESKYSILSSANQWNAPQQFNKSQSVSVSISLGTSTLNDSHYMITTPSTGSVTYTLPDASLCPGRTYIIKKLTTGVVTITPYTGQSIETGASDVSFTIPVQYDSRTFVSDGINRWHIV